MDALAEIDPEAKAAVSGYLLALIDQDDRAHVRAPRIRRHGNLINIASMEPARIDIPDHAPHVLVVDDDRRLRDLLARFLTENGYRITTAASAAEARAKSESVLFDALVLDVMMPGETGFDYARSLRQMSQIPILMLTARADTADRVTGLEIGADDYLPKPFEPRELLLRLGNILKRNHAGAGCGRMRSRSRSSISGPSRSVSIGANCGGTTRWCASPSASAKS